MSVFGDDERKLLEKHLGSLDDYGIQEKPMNGQITSAVEEFETACDAAIAAIGAGNAYTIFNQRRERYRLISDRKMMEKGTGEKSFTGSFNKDHLMNQAYMANQKVGEGIAENEHQGMDWEKKFTQGVTDRLDHGGKE